MKIISGKYPEEKNIDAWVGFINNGNVNIVFLWRYAAYCRDIIKAKNIADVGLRDPVEQRKLYDLYQAYLKDPTIRPIPNIAAAPGTSWHEYGFAIDLNRYKTNPDGTGQYYGTINADYVLWLAGKPETLNQYGLAHAVKGEIWHIQPIETIGFGGDKSKFADPDDFLRNDYVESGGLKRGDKNANVGTWQEILDSKGYALVVDNDFGPATEAATNAHKESIGLAKDGIVSFDTLLKSYSAAVKDYQSKLEQARFNAQKLNDRIDSLTNENGMLEGDIRELDQRIATLVKKIESDKFKIDTIDQRERDHQEVVANLNEQIAELLIK